MWAAELQDEGGGLLGGVRAGQLVYVLDDRIGEDGDQALVEIRSPLQVRGRLKRDRLLAFARRELPIEKDWSWWLAEAPLWLLDGDGVNARVNAAEPHGSPSTMPDISVACSELRGTPPAKLHHSMCNGASHVSSSKQSGRTVHWPEGTIVTGPADQKLSYNSPVGLLRREGDRVLVDVVDYEWYRVRGWASAAGMQRSDSWYGRGHGCCEGMLHLFNNGGQRRQIQRLRREAPLTERTDGEVIARVPRGANVIQVGRFADQALILYEGRSAGRRWPTVQLMGWLPQSALPSTSNLPPSVRGRLVFPTGTRAPAASELIVETVSDHSRQPLAGLIEADLTFAAPALEAAATPTMRARTRNGEWWGSAPVEAKAGAVEVVMKPARQIFGQIRTEDGLALPGARVHSLSEGETRSDAEGRFRLLVPDDREPWLTASAPGFQSHRLQQAAAGGVTLKLPRRRLVAGLVGRNNAGVCRETEILLETERSVPLADDCSFALDWDASNTISVGGRRDRQSHVHLSPRGGWTTIGDCTPGRQDPLSPKAKPTENVRCDVTGDVTDICLSGPCPKVSRGSLFVRVTRSATQLAPGAQVRVRAGERHVGACDALSGACFVHQLPVGQTVSVEAQAPGSKATAQAQAQVRAGVTELTLRLP